MLRAQVIKLWKTLIEYAEKSPLHFFFICILIQYSPIIFYNKKIGWDTLDAYFPNFLYMVDSFKEFSMPYYNLFSLGGISFADNFFSGPLLNPIDIFLAMVATKLPPLYIFQLQFPIFAFMSSCWIYRFFLRFNQNSMYSVLGALTFLYCTLNPLAGQSSFFYAYVLLAFLLDPCYSLVKRKNIFHFFFASVLLVTFLLKTYFFFIPFMLVLATAAHFYFCYLQKSKFEFKFVICCLLGGLVYFALMKSINAAYVQATTDLLGDFLSPEPRLRSLIPEKIYYPSRLSILADMLDNRLLPGAAWSVMTINLLILFLAQICLLPLNKDKVKTKLLIMILITLSLLSAYGLFGGFFSKIPYIKSMRWVHAYINIAVLLYLALIFIFPISLDKLTRGLRSKISILWIVVYLVMFVYAVKNHKYHELRWSLLSLFVCYFFVYTKRLFEPVFLTVLLLFSFRMVKNFEKGAPEYTKIANRNLQIKLDQNNRQPAEVGDYKWNDRSWLYDKKATLNGYNNTIHPIFWYLKGEAEASEIVIPLCPKKSIKLKSRDKYTKNDNAYLEELKADIIQLVRKNKCSRSIEKFEFTQNMMSFTAASKVTLVLQNIDSFSLANPDGVVEKKMPGGMSLLFHQSNADLKFNFDKGRIFNFAIFNMLAFLFILLYLIVIIRMQFSKMLPLK